MINVLTGIIMKDVNSDKKQLRNSLRWFSFINRKRVNERCCHCIFLNEYTMKETLK